MRGAAEASLKTEIHGGGLLRGEKGKLGQDAEQLSQMIDVLQSGFCCANDTDAILVIARHAHARAILPQVVRGYKGGLKRLTGSISKVFGRGRKQDHCDELVTLSGLEDRSRSINLVEAYEEETQQGHPAVWVQILMALTFVSQNPRPYVGKTWAQLKPASWERPPREWRTAPLDFQHAMGAAILGPGRDQWALLWQDAEAERGAIACSERLSTWPRGRPPRTEH